MSSDGGTDAGAPTGSDGRVDSATESGSETVTGTDVRSRVRGRVHDRNRLGDRSRTLSAVLGVTAVAVLLRVVALGDRIAHWDEGRVGYWILRYHETGEFFYRPIIHGPFLPIVENYLFAVVPPSDFTMRLPVALVGGLLPLAAWLFRDYLRDDETVALALLLAVNPLFVYYSRFMRNDVLVAAFALFALGFFARSVASGDARYLYPAAAAFALAVTAKENALVYLLCYLGASALLLDHRFLRAAARGRSAGTVLFDEWPAAAASSLRARGRDGSLASGTLRPVGHGVGALAVFVVVVVFFYAPRPEFWGMFSDPARVPSVVETATLGSWERFADTWVGGSHQSHDYVPYLVDYLETLVYGAPAVLAFAIVGFVGDRYGRGGHRGLVAFAAYWGIASVFGYPIATDIQAPWAAVHAVMPLSIPAAVGVAYVIRAGRSALSVGDAVATGLAVLLVVVAVAGVAGANVAYWNSTGYDDRQVLQYAQPENGMKPTLERAGAVATANEGPDVLFFGTCNPAGGACNTSDDSDALFYVEDERSLDRMPPGGPSWHSRLPLPWYLELYGAEVTSSPPDAPAEESLRDPPPVVVAYDWNRSDVEPHLDGYTASEHRFRLWNEYVVIFVDDSALGEGDGDERRGRGDRSVPPPIRSSDQERSRSIPDPAGPASV